MTGAWILVIFIVALSSAILLVLHYTPAGPLLHRHIPETPRRRILLSSFAFLLTFAGVRLLTWSIHNHLGPFHDIYLHGRHIHLLVWGIILLLVVGYGWMVDVGQVESSRGLAARRLLCILYGAAAALTLDEFALWLNLRDVYWAKEGRASVDAVILFSAALVIGIVGAPLWRGFLRELRT
jgi:hypothetical protein